MKYQCPVCGFDMSYPAAEYNICPCCGTEFGNDDALSTHEELRARWIGSGAPWFFRAPPPTWNPWQQLFQAGMGHSLARIDWVRNDRLSPIPAPASVGFSSVGAPPLCELELVEI